MTASPATDRTVFAQPIPSWRLPIILALLLLPFCFLGYGSDNDTFAVVESGYFTWHRHILLTSRHPGYWTFEAIVYPLSMAGGYLASNLATLAVGAVCIWRFHVIACRLYARFPAVLTASLVATPFFAIACTSTSDYVWSLIGIVLCAELLIADRLALAILPAAFAFAVRGANGAVVAGVILGAVLAEYLQHRHFTPRILRLLGVGLAAAALGSPPYLLSYHLAGNSMHFADSMVGPDSMQTFRVRAGRFSYKSLYIFGPLASLLLLVAVFLRRRPTAAIPRSVADYRARAMPIFAGAVLLNLVLFFLFPIEISYLIPAAFFLLLLAGTTLLARSRPLTIAFFLAVTSLLVVRPQLADPNVPGSSTDAKIHFSLHPGWMVDDVRQRLPLRQCIDHTYSCYQRNRIW